MLVCNLSIHYSESQSLVVGGGAGGGCGGVVMRVLALRGG
jgi:hypothetical protein